MRREPQPVARVPLARPLFSQQIPAAASHSSNAITTTEAGVLRARENRAYPNPQRAIVGTRVDCSLLPVVVTCSDRMCVCAMTVSRRAWAKRGCCTADSPTYYRTHEHVLMKIHIQYSPRPTYTRSDNDK